MIYLVCFGVSVLFAHLANKARNRYSFFLWSFISIIVPVMLAALRDYSIGIDTLMYYNGWWTDAVRAGSLFRFLRVYSHTASMEYLYAALLGIGVTFGKNFRVFLFCVHLVIVGGTYMGAFRLKHHAAPELTLSLFYLLYYNYSLNASRQHMALAVLFAAAVYLEQKKYLHYGILCVVAFFFHNSAILGVMPLALYIFLYPSKRMENVPIWRRILLLALIFVAVIGFNPIARFLINLGIGRSKYLVYLDQENESSYGTARLLLLVEMSVLVVYWKQIKRSDSCANFYLYSTIAFFVLYQMAPLIAYGKRIAAYFAMYNAVTLGMMVRSNKIKSNRVILTFGILLGAFAYWYFIYVRSNGSRTYPYIFGV